MARAKICYLHIGAEKTGSTSIQAFLRANRDILTEQGCLFPVSPGADNQPALAAYAMRDCCRKNLLAQVGVETEDQLDAFHATFRQALLDEVAAAAPEKIILTNEHCHSRIGTVAELERLATLLRELADDVRIIFYIRRQDLAATSLFSTALKVGQTRRKPDMAVQDQRPLSFDFWRTCMLYAQVFGKEALTVRLFDRTTLLNGDLLADFRYVTGLPHEAAWVVPGSKNPSIDRLAQRFLAAFNNKRRMRFGDKSEHYRMALVRMLEKHFSGGVGVKPSQARAQEFLAQFAEGNEAIRQHYFPDVPAPLFGDDFSMYPQQEEDWVAPIGMAFDAGARLFVAQQEEIDRLQAELDTLKAENNR